MVGLQTPEIIIILLIILILYGGKKLPELARSTGSAVKEYRNTLNEIENPKILKKLTEENENKNIVAERKPLLNTDERSILEIAKDLVNSTEEKA
jgi:sec-independent protein translocase protein TatA